MLCRILYAEDDKYIYQLMTREIQGVPQQTNGIDIVWVRTLEHLLSELRTSTSTAEGKPFDCLVLDLGLEDSRGISTLEKVAQFYAIPTIVLTTDESPELIKACLDLGARDVLVKGFDIDLLASKIINIVAHSTPSLGSKVKDGLAKTKLAVKTSSVFAGGYFMGIGQVLLFGFVLLDAYLQVKATGMWKPTDWELGVVATYTGALGIGQVASKTKSGGQSK